MKNKLNKNNLKWYGALASSFLLAHQSNAQIIYTDVNPDAVLGNGHPGYSEYFLDLNNDGNYDYQFTQTNHGGIVASQAMFGYYTPSYNINAEFAQIPGAHSFPQPVSSGFVIPDDLSPNVFSNFGYFLYTYSSGDFTVRENGFFDKYIPLKLDVNGDAYYGWVRVSMTGPHIVIKDCAFNSTPNQSIIAGDKGTAVACIDNLEPNNVRALAKKIPANANAETHGLINPPGDVDWFKFKVPGDSPNNRIILFDLPNNYNVRLFNSAGVQIGASNNQGTTNDTIAMNGLASGNYYIKVVGNNGAFNSFDCYSLVIQTGGPFKEALPSDVRNNITLFPNPAHDQLTVSGLDPINETQSIEMLDVFGRHFKTFVVPEQTASLDIDLVGLTKGVYFLHIKTNDAIILKKVVIE